jgi:hypothetical protein
VGDSPLWSVSTRRSWPMSAEIEIPDGPPWPAAQAGGAGTAGRAQSVLWVLAEDHRALVADVHARFLGHGLAAGDPTQPAARPAVVACGTAA